MRTEIRDKKGGTKESIMRRKIKKNKEYKIRIISRSRLIAKKKRERERERERENLYENY